jgi:hypothetical protein
MKAFQVLVRQLARIALGRFSRLPVPDFFFLGRLSSLPQLSSFISGHFWHLNLLALNFSAISQTAGFSPSRTMRQGENNC